MKRHIISGLLCVALFVFSSLLLSAQNQTPKKTVQLKLPAGFTALTVVEELGKNRHITLNTNGDIFVKFGEHKDGNGIMLLRDVNGDSKADTMKGFGHFKGTGIALHNGYLYASSDADIFRYKLDSKNEVTNPETPEKIVTGLTNDGQHESKAFTFDNAGNIYVNIGAPSNSCRETDRMKGSMGMDPCPLLEKTAGIWRFKGDALNQTQEQGERYATGIRNIVALDWNTQTNQLYAVQHGRDDLHRLFPDKFTEKQNSELPAEEFLLIKQGANFGWPYCYFDPAQNKRVTMPEYGGDGKKTDRCEGFEKPLLAF